MYADKITDSMRVAIEETKRRREIQQAYNEEHGITPTTIQKSVRELISVSKKVAKEEMNFKRSGIHEPGRAYKADRRYPEEDAEGCGRPKLRGGCGIPRQDGGIKEHAA